jgi:hypothetical protein
VETAATRSNAQAPASLDDRVQAPAAAGINEPSPSSRGKDELLLPTVVERKSAANEAVNRNELSKTTSELRRDARLEADRAKQQTASAAAATPPAPAAAAPAAFADKGVGAVVGGVARSVDRAAESAATEIMSPDPAVRWRIVGARLQRSTNGGVLWEAATTGITAALTAGAAPSASVCWVVGRGGVVLLSTDSRSWRRVPFPEATDLSAVRASDARTASVSTADGRTFSTTDGGVTWVLR